MGETTQPPAARYHDPNEPGEPVDDAWEATARALVGTVIDGRYRVDAILGAGAMAFVLDGWHVHLGRRVAIKVLHPELSELGEIRARFKREARAASRVAHPAVIEVSDFGVSEDGLHYLVMEHLAGVDLHRWSAARGPLTATLAAAIGEQLAGALDAIHRAGFVHRDIKPENIFVIEGEGEVPAIKVLDLGIAAVQAQRPSKDDPRLTRAGQTLGTVYFMAPEQVAARPLDGRTDLYAAGCVLFELVTGQLVFSAETPTEVMMAHLREKPRSPSEVSAVPAWFSAVVLRCLEKRPEDRFADAPALARALRDGRLSTLSDGGQPGFARPSASLSASLPAPIAPKTLARFKWWLLAAVSLLAIGAAWAVGREAEPQVSQGGEADPAKANPEANEQVAAPTRQQTDPVNSIEIEAVPIGPSEPDTSVPDTIEADTVEGDVSEPDTSAPDTVDADVGPHDVTTPDVDTPRTRPQPQVRRPVPVPETAPPEPTRGNGNDLWRPRPPKNRQE